MFEGKVLNLVYVGLWDGVDIQLGEDLHQHHAEQALDGKLGRGRESEERGSKGSARKGRDEEGEGRGRTGHDKKQDGKKRGGRRRKVNWM